MSLPAKQSLQFYSERITVEAESDTSLVTLFNVDLGELVGQVNASELLVHMERSDIMAYLASGDE